MDGLSVRKDIHIMPMGYEKKRIIDPAVQYDADYAILVEYEPRSDASDEQNDEPNYHDDVREELTAAGVEVLTVKCDIFDLYSSLGMIAQLASKFNDHHVFVNLSSGSKVTAIGGMIACMATGATPYYVKADSYAGNPIETPVASDVTDVIQLPKYPIDPPDRQHIACLAYIDANEPVTKQDLIDYGEREELPFHANYETDDVQNPTRGYYRRLDTQILDYLTEQGYIDIVERSKYRYISITEQGEDTLQAFLYLWKEETTLLSDELDRINST